MESSEQAEIKRKSYEAMAASEFELRRELTRLRTGMAGLVEKLEKDAAYYEEKSYSPLGDTVPTAGTICIRTAKALSALLEGKEQP